MRISDWSADVCSSDLTVQEKVAALRERLAEDAESLQTRITIYSISVSKNDKGETITRMLLDAQLRIASLAEDATAQEEAKSLDQSGRQSYRERVSQYV